MGFCQESSDETAKRGKVLDQGHEPLGFEVIREMGRARPDPFDFGPNQARFLGGGGGCGWGLGCGGGGGYGCGFVGSGRDETLRRFSMSERERKCGRLAKNEKALKMNRDKKNREKIQVWVGEM